MSKKKYLYKYRPLYSYSQSLINKETGEEFIIKTENPILNKNTKKMLLEGLVYFSSPLEFNDPFDCSFTIKFNKLKEKEVLAKIKNKSFSGRDTLKNMIKDYNNDIPKFIHSYNANIKEIKDTFYNSLNNMIDRYRIFCVSEDPLSLLMWSHYADSHKGICIGFEVQEIDNQTGLFFKVNEQYIFLENKRVKYIQEQERSLIDIMGIDLSTIGNSLYSKYNSWKYEKENRFILLSNEIASGKVKVVKETIKEILFGLKVEDCIIKQTLKNLKKSNYLNICEIKFYKLFEVPGYYKLFKEEIFLVNYL